MIHPHGESVLSPVGPSARPAGPGAGAASARPTPVGELDRLEAEMRTRGWPEPTERGANSFAWSAVNNDTQIRHIVAAWWGEEFHKVDDPVTGAAAMQPTGRSGVFVTGRGMVCTTLDEAADAMVAALHRQEEPALLTLFGLKRDWGLPGAPVVPLGTIRDRNEYAAILINEMGLW